MASLTNALSKLTAVGQAQVSPPSVASLATMDMEMATQKKLVQGDNKMANYVDKGHYKGHQ